MKTTVFLTSLFFTLSVRAEILPFFAAKDFSPIFSSPQKTSALWMRIPSFQLEDQDKTLITRQSIHNQVTVVNFFFATCHSVCPMLMQKLKKVTEALPSTQKYVLLSMSITPRVDTAEKLKLYAQKQKLDLAHWHLLTGEPDEMRKLEDAFKANKDVPSKQAGEVVHAENVYLLDQNGYLRGIYNASSDADLQLLRADIQTLSR
jgi:protein SCO1/2